jgi:hypothetical protein
VAAVAATLAFSPAAAPAAMAAPLLVRITCNQMQQVQEPLQQQQRQQ